MGDDIGSGSVCFDFCRSAALHCWVCTFRTENNLKRPMSSPLITQLSINHLYGMDRPYGIQYREKVATNDPIVVMCLLSSKFVQKFMQRGDLVQLQSRRHRLGMTGVVEEGTQGAMTPPNFSGNRKKNRNRKKQCMYYSWPPDFWTFRRHWLCMHSYIAWLYTAATIAQ